MTKRPILPLLCLALLLGCTHSPPPPAAAPREPLFEGLGTHARPVTTSSPEAQRYFNQGLNLLFGFNHDEAIRSFRQAAEWDPSCAMAHWGVALANGPHINNPTVDADHAKAAREALARARENGASASEVERDLIHALGARYADPRPEDRKSLDEAYASAMRTVWERNRQDADVGALFAEAMMDLRPWDLWTPDGEPQPGTGEILSTLEQVLAIQPTHPLANHLYIHVVEASTSPEKGDASADRLRDLQPGLGHMVHMPSHIDVRRGRWSEAVVANEKAIEADRRYRAIVPEQGFYHVYMAHNRHMLAYASMMQGRSELAVQAIREMVAGIPEDWLRANAGLADGFLAMPLEVLMRFGRWEEILAEPEPAEYLPIARAFWRCARGIAYAAQGKVAEAQAEERAFLEARARVPADAFFGNNAAPDLLRVAEHLLRGEVLYRAGSREEGIRELARAAEAEDRLRYNEPPDWITPVRHALGATLLQDGRTAEAERVYREDLRRIPENGWSLFGLARSLRLQGRDAEAEGVEERFRRVWEKGDVKITSSCPCQPGV